MSTAAAPANKGFGKFWYDLPKPAKAVLGIAGGLTAVFGIFIPTYRLIKSNLDAAKMKREGAEAKDELNKLEKKGIRPTISPVQAETFVNSLIAAFDECGTDEDAVYNVMKQMKNDADVYLLINTWGIRKYDYCFWGRSDDGVSLSFAISDELDWSEKAKANKYLKANGVNFQWT